MTPAQQVTPGPVTADGMPRRAYSAKEVAQMTGRSVWWVHELIRSGELVGRKAGGVYLVRVEDFEDFMSRADTG